MLNMVFSYSMKAFKIAGFPVRVLLYISLKVPFPDILYILNEPILKYCGII